MIEAGTFLQNRYRIDRKIGQGGMGAVFVATDERFDSIVAIKETFFADENYRKAFEREARLLNNLRHPALPRVSDHFSEDDGQFLVMEYIPGADLSEKLETSNEPFLVEEVLNWADQLLDALDFLHTQEMPVIHRDIKPQNLKLTPRGQIILLDFGLAKGNPSDSKSQTAHSVFGYSRNYASLEQIQGTGTDPRSDLYSLSATLYHLMTGVPPVDALTRAMTVLNGNEDPLTPANEINNQISGSIAEVLERAMALNANHRPTSAVAMRAMLAESDKNAGNFNTSSTKKSAVSLLAQNTEVFENKVESARFTEQAKIDTEILPLAVSAVESPNTETKINTPVVSLPNDDAENSVLTQVNAAKESATVIQPNVNLNQPNSNKSRFFGATALGGLVLVGSGIGALYFFTPTETPTTNANTVETVISNQSNSVDNQNETANINSANTNQVEKETLNQQAKTALGKKDEVPKSIDKPVADDKTAVGKNTKTVGKNSASANKDEVETVEFKDENGDTVKMTADGRRIETKDVIIDNGRVIMKNGNRRVPPKTPLPPNMKDLPPEERQRIINIMRRRNQNRQNPQNQPPAEPPEQP